STNNPSPDALSHRTQSLGKYGSNGVTAYEGVPHLSATGSLRLFFGLLGIFSIYSYHSFYNPLYDRHRNGISHHAITCSIRHCFSIVTVFSIIVRESL